MLTVLDDWTEAMDNGEQVDTIYLDFRKAFDSVPHKRLLHKVKAYGISGKMLTWLTKFLSDRKQRVVVNGEFSEWTSVLSGVPQGSILGPVLFIIFINDLPEVIESICRLFADDAKVYKVIGSERDQDQLQKDLDSLFKWSEDWLLRFNVQKCKAMQVGKVHLECEYSMNNDKLKVENSEKDLGILFTSNLNFDKHISSIVNKANRVIALIRRKFTYMDKNLFLTLYKALVRSTLDYGNIIFHPSTKKNKQMLENVQRRATRLVPELRDLSYIERLAELQLSTLEYRRKRFDLIQVFKIVHGFDKVY